MSMFDVMFDVCSATEGVEDYAGIPWSTIPSSSSFVDISDAASLVYQ